jgi:hypothetical protein
MYVGLMTFLIIGCHRGEMPRPLNFTAYEGNPILSPGAPGEWDELFLWNPQPVFHEGVFYLFFTGGNVSGRMAVGLATSEDGLHFSKYHDNPVLSPGEDGPGSYTIGPGILLKADSLWWMFYNAQDLAAFAPGSVAGRATATFLYGPWIKDESPVISSGSKGEWDAGFIIPSSVLMMNDGTFMMFYSAGNDIVLFDEFYIGMATSPDGLIWTKYNDPLTTKHPFAESDPVLTSGQEGEWDAGFVWMANVTYTTEGFRMYYSASAVPARNGLKAIGYAESRDGIHWVKYLENPVYSIEQAMNIKSPENIAFMENPALIYLDTICLMFYEYGDLRLEATRIGVATAKLK